MKKSKSTKTGRAPKAKDLRKQIQRLKQLPPGDSRAEALPAPMSPREFIHRRMRSLDGKPSR